MDGRNKKNKHALGLYKDRPEHKIFFVFENKKRVKGKKLYRTCNTITIRSYFPLYGY